MRAVAYRHARPVTAEDALVDVEIDRPEPGPHDLLVKVEAVSVNPVDTKVRRGNDPGGEAKVLGFDAAGTVAEVGGAGDAVQAGRCGLVCRLDRAAGQQQRIPCGRRAHRRAEAGQPRFRRGRGAAADRAHRLGAALRPHRGEPGPRGRPPLAAHRRRGRRRRLDRHPARPRAHRHDRDRHRLAAGDGRLGQGARRPSRHRPFQAAAAAARRARPSRRSMSSPPSPAPGRTQRRSPRSSRRKGISA